MPPGQIRPATGFLTLLKSALWRDFAATLSLTSGASGRGHYGAPPCRAWPSCCFWARGLSSRPILNLLPATFLRKSRTPSWPQLNRISLLIQPGEYVESHLCHHGHFRRRGGHGRSVGEKRRT